MKNYKCRYINRRHRGGFALVFVVVIMVVLMLIGTALLTITYGMRLRAIKLKGQTVAMLAAEAGYEKGIYWMNAVPDVLTGLLLGNPPGLPADLTSSGTLNFADSSCTYSVQCFNYIGGVPVFRVVSTGTCGAQKRVVDVYVKQAITGWDMGLCRIPNVGIANGTPISYSSTGPVHFVDDEIIDMTVHINKNDTNPAGERDIYISGSPEFHRQVEMGESRYNGGSDKYAGVIGCFEGGIIFDQPDSRITDKATVDGKLARFKSSTKTAGPNCVFTPRATANVTGLPSTCSLLPAVQMEFYGGNVRIRNNCTVVGYSRPTTHDYWINSSGNFERYYIYAYHYQDGDSNVVSIASTEVRQLVTCNGQLSDLSGQIYVEGNVILDSNTYDQLVVGGKLTIVATGNIWIGDSIYVAGSHDANGPTANNVNALGLIAGGVVKVIDPGMSGYAAGGTDNYPGPPSLTPIPDKFVAGKTHTYMPAANYQGSGAIYIYNRVLSNPRNTVNTVDPTDSTVVEAAITCGGGGWGAENVYANGYGGRKQVSGNQDPLIVRGTICEAVRGIVGVSPDYDGYIKNYHLDERLLEGVLPGNIWFGGKFIPAPAGWHDYGSN